MKMNSIRMIEHFKVRIKIGMVEPMTIIKVKISFLRILIITKIMSVNIKVTMGSIIKATKVIKITWAIITKTIL